MGLIVFLVLWVVFAHVFAAFVVHGIPLLFELACMLIRFFALCVIAAVKFIVPLTIRVVSWFAMRARRLLALGFEFAAIFAEEWLRGPQEEPEQPEGAEESEEPIADLYGEALALFELEPGFGKAELRRAYRNIMKLAHPDAPGGSTQAGQQANLAYERIMREHGWT